MKDERPDDAMLEALGALARDQADERDAWWAQIDAGQAPDGSEFDEIAPLTEDERARIVDHLAALSPAVEPEPANVVAFSAERARRARRAWTGIGVVAAAAAVAVFMLRALTAVGVRLPAYALATSTGDKAFRGSEDGRETARAVYTRGSRFEFVLRPLDPVDSEVAAAAWLVGADGPRDWPVYIEHGRSGGLRIVGTIGAELDAPDGDWDVVFAVAPAGGLPDRDAISTPPDRAAWQRLVLPIRLESSP